MKKLNKIAYDRLICQAEGARDLGLSQIVEGVLNAVGPVARDECEKESYSSLELEKDIHNGLWKLAVNIMAYHDTKAIDAEKVDDAISRLSEVVIKEIESSLGALGKVGSLEPKLPGEKE